MRPLFRLATACAFLLGSSATARASEELRNAIAELAEKTISVLPGNPKAVKVGRLTCKTGIPLHVTSEEGIRLLLIQELNVRSPGIVRDDAKVEVNGDIKLVSLAPDSEVRVIKIQAVVENEDNTAVRIPVEALIDSNKAISEVLQVTFSRPAAKDPAKERTETNKEIQKNVNKNPDIHLAGTRISSREGRPFEIEVLEQPLEEFGKKPPSAVAAKKEANGLPFVSIARGELYEIKVYNHSGAEVAVAVSIDGIDMFHFSRDRVIGEGEKKQIKLIKDNEPLEGRPRFSHFILQKDDRGKPQEELTIQGWHHSVEGTDNFRSFLVTAYGQGRTRKPASRRWRRWAPSTSVSTSATR